MDENMVVTEVVETAPVEKKNIQKEIDRLADAAFGKCLASCIMAWFPIASIIAIVQGSRGLKLERRCDELCDEYGCFSGKRIAARICGIIGKAGGITMTVAYVIIFITAAAMTAFAYSLAVL